MYLISAWGIFTSFMTVATLRTTIALFSIFFTLSIAFILLAVGYYRGADEGFLKAGGYMALFTAFAAWYSAMAGIWTTENSFIRLPLGHFPWSPRR
jgi:uncharacterized protein